MGTFLIFDLGSSFLSKDAFSFVSVFTVASVLRNKNSYLTWKKYL